MNKQKLIIFILAFCLSCSLSNGQYLKELKLNDNTAFSDTINSTQTLTEKSPFLAGTLSFIIPGLSLGQIYNNVPSKVIRHLSISLGSFTLLIIAGELKWFRMDIACGANNHDTWIPVTLAFIYLGNWIWSVADAVITANDINKQIMIQKYRSDFMNRLKLGFNVDKNKQFNIKFALDL